MIKALGAMGGEMRTWIFQGNPDDFDLNGYLATAPAQLPWLVTRYADDIKPGDRVYIWRARGKSKAVAGVIAEAEVIAPVALRSESADAVPFWRAGAPEASERRPRALLRLVRVATPREVIRRDWCREDPILQTLPNLKMAAGTNYPLASEQAERLAALWTAAVPDAPSDEQAVDQEARALEQDGLAALMARYNNEVGSRPRRARATAASMRVFERSALVVAIARLRANHHCEVPGCAHPAFVREDGTFYTEVHHIVPLGEGGEDVLSNVACVCPAHHREAHVGKRAQDVGEALKAVRASKRVLGHGYEET
jgi:hypothetical protein